MEKCDVWKKGQTDSEKWTLTWREALVVTVAPSCLWLSHSVWSLLELHCVFNMYLSHIVYQIFISISLKLNIFRTSLVTMLWITLKHCGTFIVVWGMCWLCAGTVDIQAKTTFYNVHPFAFMLSTEHNLGPKAQIFLVQLIPSQLYQT